MELTAYCYSLGETAYGAYCKQAGGKSLATGDTLPAFAALPQAIKDAWAASAIAVSNRLDHQAGKYWRERFEALCAAGGGA